MEDEHYEPLSNLRARRKKPSVSLSCCFNGHRRADSFDSTPSIMPSPGSRISPSALKGRCKNFIFRRGRHRRHASADFSYDPLSYSLNFEDNDHHHEDTSEVEECPSFASRLPLSPPRRDSFKESSPSPSPWPASSSARRAALMTGNLGQRSRSPDQLGHISRAAAVAEVRKSLEEASSSRNRINIEPHSPRKVEEMRRISGLGELEVTRSPDIPTARKVKNNIDMLTPRAPPEVRRSYDYDHEVSAAMVASPTSSRQVLVELC